MKINTTKISKYLSLVLRHDPGAANIVLDANGWVDIPELLRGAESVGKSISREQLEYIVSSSEKARFVISDDRIRANQGHSIDVDLKLSVVQPPNVLYHGTVEKYLDSILKQGLKKMNRHHVHLSPDIETANIVGKRRGKPIILEINAEQMQIEGYEFMCSKNGVWLTEAVPSNYIALVETNV